MMTPDRKKLPTLEELLRLKRVERPSPEFWSQFESELRAKQLAAIMERRPWWASYARILGALLRHPAPIGAAAALAFTFVGYHGYQIVQQRHNTVHSTPVVELAQASTSASAASETLAADPVYSQQAVVRSDVVQGNATAVAYREGDLTRTRGTDWPADSVDSPSARSIAANLAEAQASEPEVLRNLLGFSRSLDAGLIPERRPVSEPLARMVSPSAERRARLLAAALPVVATVTEATRPLSEHFVNRISDDRLYESISRYGSGDGGSFGIKVKF